MAYEELSNSGFVFALDIGTRSVVGILGKKENDKINIEHIAVEFHQKRVMYNGQIHDIDGVTEIVRKVKTNLEEKAQCSLDQVSIAVAGRSLKTNKVTIDREIDSTKDIDKDLINSLEVEGLQKAQYELEKQGEEYTKYFCVGHTVVHYYINDGIITNPLGHKGNKIKLDILATFLPQIVVDSLYVVTSKLNLEVSYMTLEPIAAIEVAIPENARLLNLALVDIGAGTSDVAITKEGTVVAYGMTASAGDDITEEISRCYLLDFDTAENLKINLCKEKIQKFSDIVGIPYEIESEEILKKIESAIKKVAKLIASNIIEQNGKSPSAVFLIGGGSQIPYLNTFIAKELNLPEERVVVRGIETIKNTVLIREPISGPEYITPIGILAKAVNNQELDFIEIYINGQRSKLFQTKKLKVKDALVLAGFNPRKLIPKRGKSINIILNDNNRTLYGEYGEVAEILINGKASNIESSIKDGDIIKVHPAEEGQPATYLLKDIVPLEDEIFINGESTLQVYNCTINNEKAEGDIIIKEDDNIQYCRIESIENLCTYMDVSYDEYIIKINDKIASLDEKIRHKDYVSIEKKVIVNNLQEVKENSKEQLQLTKESILVKCNDSLVEIPKKNGGVIFVDIFDYIDFDRSTVQGKLVLLLNGHDANYTDFIETGDEIKVYWDN
ncbi:pilus assembly protein PilM [Alkaliphilus sp. MSJ-5]|uniref:Pilus assembly protein PilM n=1 Tax=Alkaliphilus flagellatus TaxID=2841507 RepID=A0ABS6FYQ7_9FIRM|nr:pilus assembly protein PilM [Alkaliphilus flagellatus]MBU5675383.1 pilus assembly protein PilM [Alkaliphilus flagellatus]